MKMPLNLMENLTKLYVGGELQHLTKFRWLKIKLKIHMVITHVPTSSCGIYANFSYYYIKSIINVLNGFDKFNIIVVVQVQFIISLGISR